MLARHSYLQQSFSLRCISTSICVLLIHEAEAEAEPEEDESKGRPCAYVEHTHTILMEMTLIPAVVCFCEEDRIYPSCGRASFHHLLEVRNEEESTALLFVCLDL